MIMDVRVCLLSIILWSAQLVNAEVKAYDEIAFSNVGFAGTFTPVKKISNINNDKCTCEVAEREWFSGTNAPIAGNLSVHFRGPLRLHKFAFYDSPSFVVKDEQSSKDWTRRAYYESNSDSSDLVGDNVVFLTKAGEDSPCLGKALTYANDEGVGSATSPTLLKGDNEIKNDEEYVIFSNVTCPKSGLNNACGVYRKGIPAYHGFGGITKMFLFDFEMPRDVAGGNSSSIRYFDLPAIWLLNDNIPRTAQYPTNPNCSCWQSGCGEFDIFEAMNGTERDHLYSTFHTFQGIEDLGTGIQSYGYFPRDVNNSMTGGVIFDSAGDVIAFLSNSTKFDSTLTFNDINSILSAISDDETYSSELMSISATAPSTTSKSSGFAISGSNSGFWYYFFTVVTAVTHVFMI